MVTQLKLAKKSLRIIKNNMIKKGYVYIIAFSLFVAIGQTLKSRFYSNEPINKIELKFLTLLLTFLIPGLFLVRYYYKKKGNTLEVDVRKSKISWSAVDEKKESQSGVMFFKEGFLRIDNKKKIVGGGFLTDFETTDICNQQNISNSKIAKSPPAFDFTRITELKNGILEAEGRLRVGEATKKIETIVYKKGNTLTTNLVLNCNDWNIVRIDGLNRWLELELTIEIVIESPYSPSI